MTPGHRCRSPLLRLRTGGATALASLAVVAGCSRAGGLASQRTVPVAEVQTRYQAAMGPAGAALGAIVTQALAYSGAPTAALDANARKTASTLGDAGRRAGAIAAPQPIERDIADVVAALNAITGDLNDLAGARSSDIEPAIARLVADAGREQAADTLVRLALTAALTPTTTPLTTPVTEPVTTPPTTVVPVATTVPKHTATTRARPTTVPRTTTTRATSTTLKH